MHWLDYNQDICVIMKLLLLDPKRGHCILMEIHLCAIVLKYTMLLSVYFDGT